MLRWRSLQELSRIDITWGWEVSHVMNLALPPQRLKPDTRPEHQDPVSQMAQKKREKKRKKKIKNFKK